MPEQIQSRDSLFVNEQKSNVDRLPYIDLLKFIALSCFLMEHIQISTRMYMLCCVDVPLFVFILSYLEKRAIDGCRGVHGILNFYWLRIKRLLLPTWLFLSLYFVFRYLVDGATFDPEFYIYSFALTRYGFGYVWVVLAILYAVILVPLFAKTGNKRFAAMTVMACYVLYEIACYFMYPFSGITHLFLESTLFVVIPYGAVAFVGFKYEGMSKKKKIILTGLVGAVFIAFFAYYQFTTGNFARAQLYRFPPRQYYVVYGLFASLVLLAVSKWVTNARWIPKIFYDNFVVRFAAANLLSICFCFVFVLDIYNRVNPLQRGCLKYVAVYTTALVAVFVYKCACGRVLRFCRKRWAPIVFCLVATLIASWISCTIGNGKGKALVVPENQPVVETLPNLSHFVLDSEKNGTGKKNNEGQRQVLNRVLNRNLKYLLNTWWNSQKPEALYQSSNMKVAVTLSGENLSQVRLSQKSFANWRDAGNLYLAINPDREKTENSIRPLSHVCDILAMALVGDYYDESLIGVAKKDAKSMLIKLMSAAADAYIENKWGKTWQSSLWAENIGYAAWLIWNDVPKKVQEHIVFMILSEADYVLNMEIPYYRDKDGNVLYEGDTKGEEIAWNSKILALALCLFPSHENSGKWAAKLEQMLVAATAKPEDLLNKTAVDGIVPAEFLNGSNINSDGTVVNHGRSHIDYMTTIVEEMTESAILFKLTGRNPLESSVHNVDLIFNALVNVDLGTYDKSKAGKHFYQRGENGGVSGSTDMPGKNDWGGHWYGSFYLTDVYADLFALDKNVEERYKAARWEQTHLDEIAVMLGRNSEGNFFVPGENNFVSGEMFQMHNVVRAYTLKKLFAE